MHLNLFVFCFFSFILMICSPLNVALPCFSVDKQNTNKNQKLNNFSDAMRQIDLRARLRSFGPINVDLHWLLLILNMNNSISTSGSLLMAANF